MLTTKPLLVQNPRLTHFRLLLFCFVVCSLLRFLFLILCFSPTLLLAELFSFMKIKFLNTLTHDSCTECAQDYLDPRYTFLCHDLPLLSRHFLVDII